MSWASCSFGDGADSAQASDVIAASGPNKTAKANLALLLDLRCNIACRTWSMSTKFGRFVLQVRLIQINARRPRLLLSGTVAIVLAGVVNAASHEVASMLVDTPTSEQLSQVIAQVTAPSFILGAVAAFLSLLISRMNRVIDRIQTLSDRDEDKKSLKQDIPRLKRRAELLNKAILYAGTSAILTCLLVIVAFISAYFRMRHEYGVALLFVIALGFFTASLTNLVREARMSLHEYDLHK